MTSAARDEMRVSSGTVIFRQGDTGNEMFVISRGRVRLTLASDGHEREIATCGPGEFFGELSLLRDAPRSATAVAVEDSTLLVIERDVFAMMMQDDLETVFHMMNTQGRRLTQANEPVLELVQRIGRVRVAARVLRHSARNELPLHVEVPALADELSLSVQATTTTVADLVRQGIGTLAGQVWTLGTRGEIDRLLEALCRYADGVET
jgi:CRP/FNR family cyclic AMP-dependent transcriptional regulator